MYTSGYRLKSDLDFDNAIIFRLVISITEQDMHVTSGFIKAHDSEVVYVNNTAISKKQCEFEICL